MMLSDTVLQPQITKNLTELTHEKSRVVKDKGKN